MDRKAMRRSRGRSDTSERLSFLCELRPVICSEVSTTLMLQRVARLAASSLCEYCIVDLVDDDGGVQRIEIAHADASLVDHLRVWAEDFTPTPGGRIERMIASGEADLVPSARKAPPKRTVSGLRPAVKVRPVKPASQGSPGLDFWPAVRIASYVAVPVKVAGKVRAIITFAASRASARFDDERLSFALEIAGWCGLALEVERALPMRSTFAAEPSTSLRRKSVGDSAIVPKPSSEAAPPARSAKSAKSVH